MSLVINDLYNIDRLDDLDDCVVKNRPISAVHIRLQQRNGKKCLTLVEGLAEDLNLKKIVSAVRRTLQTSGAILKKDDTEVLQFGGDCRVQIKDFLIKYKIVDAPDPDIKMHGF